MVSAVLLLETRLFSTLLIFLFGEISVRICKNPSLPLASLDLYCTTIAVHKFSGVVDCIN